MVKAPDDPREWRLDVVARILGFQNQEELGGVLGQISARGYSPFVLRDGAKARVIHSPRPWLKDLQRTAYEQLFLAIPVSPFVYNRPGLGVVKSAQRHLANTHMVVLDVANCFPSTRIAMVRAAFAGLGIPSPTAEMLTRLTTFDGELPHGPPTSPGVLDIVFRPIDADLHELAVSRGATFTRYMDDLAFSGNQPLASLPKDAGKILGRFEYRTRSSKARIWGPDDPHSVTSIVVNTSLNATPEFIAELAKFLAQLDHGNCRLSRQQLRGKVAWVKSLNRELGLQLERRLRQALSRSRAR